MRAARWKMLIKPLGRDPSISNAFYAVMIGYLTNLAIPRLGEFMRAWSLNKTDEVPVASSLGTIVVERVIDVIMLVLMAVCVILFNYDLLGGFFMDEIFIPFISKFRVDYLQVALLASFLIILVIGFRYLYKKRGLGKRLQGIVLRFGGGLKSIRQISNSWIFISYTIGIWVCYVLGFYTKFFAFQSLAGLGIGAGIMTFTFGTFAMMAPVQGGIGAFHWLVMQALILLGISREEGLAFATIGHAASMLFFLIIGGLSYLMVVVKMNKDIAASSD